jgi:hypothetical protein
MGTIRKIETTRRGETDKFKILEVCNDLLGVCLGTLFESFYMVRMFLLEVAFDGLHISLHRRQA